MPPEEDIFHDITDASSFQPSMEFPLLWVIIGIGIACLILLIATLLYRRFANKPQETHIDHVAVALEKIPALQEVSAQQSVQQSASELSTLIRQTLTSVTKAPSVYQSQQEFHQKANFQLEDTELAASFTTHLDALWQLEYTAPSHETAIMGEHYSTAQSLLEKLASLQS